MLIAGNSFDYPFIHGKAIQAAGNHSFVSCSNEAVEKGFISMNDYPIVDLIMGAEKKAFGESIRRCLTEYTRQGGKLLLSGSYIGSEMNSPSEMQFTESVLKYTNGGSLRGITNGKVSGANGEFTFPTRPNEKTYAVPAPDCLLPIGGAYSTFVYTPGNYGAGIAYKGTDYRTFVLGFPLECIEGAKERGHIMKAILTFFD